MGAANDVERGRVCRHRLARIISLSSVMGEFASRRSSLSRLTYVLSVVLTGVLFAGQVSDGARAESLEEAFQWTYEKNPRLLAGRAQLRAVDESVPQALSGFRPTVSFDNSFTGTNVETDRTESDGPSAGTALNLRQSLYSGGGTVASVAAAEESVKAQRANLLALEQGVFFDVVTAYTSTWRDRAVLELALSNRARIERQLQATRDRFRVGDVARTDVAQAEARLARSESDIEQARAELSASVAFYRDVVGAEPGELEDPAAVDGLPETLDAAQELARRNPLVVASEHIVRNSRHRMDVAAANLWPSLDLTGQLAYTDEPAAGVSWQKKAQIGLQLSVPLYQGGRVYSEVRQSRQTLTQRQKEYEASLRSVQRSVTTAWERLLAARAAIVAIESQVRASRIALNGVQEEAFVGQRTVLDVLDAEQELFQAQTDFVRASSIAVIASYELKSAIGELTVSGLELPVVPYDSSSYYDQQRTRLFGIDAE
ncbi:MAG: TolC family outer membrane protein [Geminicoccaceae bacterium]